MNLKEVAQQYHSWGLSVVPCDKDKRPKGEWKISQYERREPNGNFNNSWGLGIICGAVSGNVEVIDIDLKYDITGTLYQRIKEAIKHLDFVRDFVVEETQNSGIHFFYKCDIIGANQAFAKRHTTEGERVLNPKEKTKVIIETRGEGGFIVTTPSPNYKIVSRKSTDFSMIPTITIEQRLELIEILKTFDETDMWKPKEEVKKVAVEPRRLGVGVFEDFNIRGDVPQLLIDNGWTYVEQDGQNMRFKRAGATDSRTSADYHVEKRLLFVFTSSTEFEPSRAYNPSQVFTMFECGNLEKESYRLSAQRLRELGYGEQDAQDDEIQKQIELEKTNNYLADDNEIDAFLQSIRDDTVSMGVGVGLDSLDHYWLYKPATFNMVGGMSNVGKTDWLIWWLTCLSIKHDFNWLIASMENEAGEIIKMAIEYKCAKKIKDLTHDQYIQAKAWAKQHFTLFVNKRTFTYHEVLNSAKEEMRKKAYAGLLIDPQSSLELDVKELKTYGEYRYHYRSATQMRLFTKQTGCSIFLVAHPNTEANKRMKDGYAQAPIAADIEFGTMWQNRCDNSITVHRVINHPLSWMNTEIHVRKIKSKYSGGDITSEPILLSRHKDCYFTDTYGKSPVSYGQPQPYGTTIDDTEEIAPF